MLGAAWPQAIGPYSRPTWVLWARQPCSIKSARKAIMALRRCTGWFIYIRVDRGVVFIRICIRKYCGDFARLFARKSVRSISSSYYRRIMLFLQRIDNNGLTIILRFTVFLISFAILFSFHQFISSDYFVYSVRFYDSSSSQVSVKPAVSQ